MSKGLTEREFKLLAAAWLSCETPPKPNYDTIAKICGYKNGGSAAVIFGNLKRKLIAADNDTDPNNGDASGGTKKPRPTQHSSTTKKRKLDQTKQADPKNEADKNAAEEVKTEIEEFAEYTFDIDDFV